MDHHVDSVATTPWDPASLPMAGTPPTSPSFSRNHTLACKAGCPDLGFTAFEGEKPKKDWPGPLPSQPPSVSTSLPQAPQAPWWDPLPLTPCSGQGNGRG